ncbi:MAG TPA: hypothetical protein VF717_17525 [Pyrinomonadaceae bacterium]
MYLNHGTRQRVLECRRRLRRSRVTQRGACTAPEVDGCETEAWPQGATGGAPAKASAETPMTDKTGANLETACPPVAEVDHFSSLRAR